MQAEGIRRRDNECAAAQHAAALQCLPHGSGRRRDGNRQQARAVANAVGPRATMVVETAERTARGDVQCSSREFTALTLVVGIAAPTSIVGPRTQALRAPLIILAERPALHAEPRISGTTWP